MTATTPAIRAEISLHNRLREMVKAENENLDERTLADTLEGLTNLNEMLAAIVRAALKDETDVAVLRVMMGEMEERRDRIAGRAERRRQMVRDAMLEANIERLNEPDFGASLRRAAPHAVVVDEALVPETFFELRRHLDKRGLLAALKMHPVEGAELSNPQMTLTVRTR